MNVFRRCLVFLVIVVLWGTPSPAKSDVQKNQESLDEMKKKSQKITKWQMAGPAVFRLPVFHKDKHKGFKPKDLLAYEPLEVQDLWPEKNTQFSWFDGEKLTWTPRAEEDSLLIQPLPTDSTTLQIAWLATYVNTKRWVKAKLLVTSHQMLKVYCDGQVVATKEKAEKKKPGKVDAELKLETGKHRLLVKMLYNPATKSEWSFKAAFEFDKTLPEDVLETGLSPEHIFQLEQLVDGPKISSATISPTGKYVAVNYSQNKPPDGDAESWIELREYESGAVVTTYRGGMRISGLRWAPRGNRFSYTNRKNGKTTLWLVDLDRATHLPLLKDVENFSYYTWAPDAQFIIYSQKDQEEPDKSGVKRLRGLYDRTPSGRDRRFLYQLTIPGGVTRRLTAGELSTGLDAIHPDGSALLFTRAVEDISHRPYSKTELYHFDLKKWKIKQIWSGYHLNSACWSPDGKNILVLAGPSAFGELGKNVPAGTIPNEYDGQAYIFDLALKQGEAITKSFAPSINSAIWSKHDGQIYFRTTDRSRVALYRYHPQKKTFTKLKSGVDVVTSFSIAETSGKMVFTGNSVNQPPAVYKMKLSNQSRQRFVEAGKTQFQKVNFTKEEPWHFTNAGGVQIDGRLYYPPDFDPAKKYPCIVYYYGGTSPVTRDFGGRYPKEFYASQGYVVYVLQPSGAVGFGQEFSALHVNDWGKIVADEIIDGVKQFLAAHPFVDAKRVGCLGASYGGFMTQLLITRTDIFAAAISHAGISALSSYWGEGYWGYIYSAVATANSFPWNRRDIYVDQSPLFSADKIVTPLLLTHGAGDTNVPPGESEQMYIALKLLGKDVEYLKIDDQNHWVLDYKKRIRWTKSIIAWFDKWLKEQPEFWNDLYPKSNEK